MRRDTVSHWFRGKRDVALRKFLAGTPRQGKFLRVIDVGGRSAYWQRVGIPFLREHCITVELVNLFETELQLSDDEKDVLTCRVGDACGLDYADDAFDLYHSNSVIEHVGQWDAMKKFASEARRVARHLYVQTPNFWFIVDPHFPRLPFLHWLPHPLKARCMMWLPLAAVGRARDLDTAYRFVDSSILLSKKQMRLLFPDCKIVHEKVFGLRKSLIAMSAAEVAYR